jgi:hypothetical protein
MTTELSTILAFISVAVIAIAAIGVWWINRTPTFRRDASETLPLFTGLATSGLATVPEPPAVRSPAVRSPDVPSPREHPTRARRVTTPSEVAVEPRATNREFNTILGAPPMAQPVALARPSAVRTMNAPVLSDAGVPGTMVEGHAIRFSVPAEGTMQFLPGRLVIGTGVDAGREIRFVQVPGPNGTEVTFGRTEGALYRHIQLSDLTVSRQHAVMQWRGGHWYLRNLSHTNPVARNGAVLDTVDAPCLQDGDRIEMGEVVFTFRGR